MKRKSAILAAFLLFLLVSLLLIAATPLGKKPVKANLDFSEGCLRGYLWDPTIQHIACSLPPTGDATYSRSSGDSEDQPGGDRDANPPKDDGKDKKHPDDKKDDSPNGKSCPKADNTNKQGHHNCGKGPGPGEHDNGKRGGGHGKPDSQGKGRGRDK